ncbi:autophagy-related protein Atg10 [Aspergillus lentulus]|nr:autophagy-related protein Atg10 [Aspergillus lentulus]
MTSPSSQGPLSAFPSLTPEEFACACRAFLSRVHDLARDPVHVHWSSVRLVQKTTGAILKISRSIEHLASEHIDDITPELGESQEPNLCEDDPETLIRTIQTSPGLHVDYDILLSPVYRVPVLYFLLRRDGHPQSLGIDAVYHLLVPDQYKKELKSVGVMGGISVGYHPESGVPAFFVHPCNTADAMMRIVGWRKITAETYLLIWLGLVGNCVGLRLPCEIFATDTQEPFPELNQEDCEANDASRRL